MYNKLNKFNTELDEEDLEYLDTVRLKSQYSKYKSRDRKIQKRRERDDGDWYD